MLLDSLNINSLRVFERVYHTKSMTAAAKEMGLTQSGVSQHMKNLEQNLGKKLFDRLKHRLVPTREADDLAKSCHRHFRALERSLRQIIANRKPIAAKFTWDFHLNLEITLSFPY